MRDADSFCCSPSDWSSGQRAPPSTPPSHGSSRPRLARSARTSRRSSSRCSPLRPCHPRRPRDRSVAGDAQSSGRSWAAGSQTRVKSLELVEPFGEPTFPTAHRPGSSSRWALTASTPTGCCGRRPHVSSSVPDAHSSADGWRAADHQGGGCCLCCVRRRLTAATASQTPWVSERESKTSMSTSWLTTAARGSRTDQLMIDAATADKPKTMGAHHLISRARCLAP